MKTLIIAADGATLIYEGKQTTGRPERQKDATSVYVLANDDGAAIAFGTKNSAGTFVTFPDGTVTDAAKINHGTGVEVWVNIVGITANSVELGISN